MFCDCNETPQNKLTMKQGFQSHSFPGKHSEYFHEQWTKAVTTQRKLTWEK